MSPNTADDAPVRRLGLLGGTFDPPHRGHVAAARAVLRQLGLDRVDLLPANDPWQKTADGSSITPAAIRVEMVRALVKNVPDVGVDDREVRRGGPTYTVDTLREIVAEMPNTRIFLIVGSDTAARIGTWREYEDVLALSTLVVVNRGHDTFDRLPTRGTVEHVAMDPVDVSSTSIRRAVADGHDVSADVGPGVMDVIARHSLYGWRG